VSFAGRAVRPNGLPKSVFLGLRASAIQSGAAHFTAASVSATRWSQSSPYWTGYLLSGEATGTHRRRRLLARSTA
jgi:hypothetical protein